MSLNLTYFLTFLLQELYIRYYKYEHFKHY